MEFKEFESVSYKGENCVILEIFDHAGKTIYQLEGSVWKFDHGSDGYLPIYYATKDELKPL